MSKILITVPDLSLKGGVAAIYRTLKWTEGDQVSYFINTSGNGSRVWFVPRMFFRFLAVARTASAVQVNPSFDFKAVTRDGLLILFSKMLNKKSVVFFHGWDDRFEKKVRENSLYRRLFLWTFRKADAFILLGSVFAGKLRELGIRDKRVHFLPTIADDSVLSGSVAARRGGNGRTILFLARFDRLKGADIVLKTFRILQREGREDLRLIMAGDGPELPACRRYVRDNRIAGVTFTGYIEGTVKHQCYLDADIIFLPSYTEGLPCVMMEAMLYGLAVVTRPVGGIPDWIRHNENGWLSESTDPEVFAAGIASLLDEPEKLGRMKEQNRLTGEAWFTPARFRDQLVNVYNEVLNEA